MGPESMPEYPECEKMRAAMDDSAVISQFLEWMDESGLVVARWPEEHSEFAELMPVGRNKEKLLADFFGIDLDKVEAERQHILKNL